MTSGTHGSGAHCALVQMPTFHRQGRIFCNRSLNMKTIKAVGFDMDYTLGLYKPDTFETLAYAEALKKLVKIGYPDSILSWEFDWRYMIRGLAIDKARGNIIKLDRHRYVKVAYHGFRELSRQERRHLYDASRTQSYEEPDFALIDTLFSLSEAYLFCQMVELKDSRQDLIKKSYHEIYLDIRSVIDLCHRDGSIKRKVAENPGIYIQRDTYLAETLQKLKDSGRKLFIVTNSLWDYTNVVMNYLLGHKDLLSDEWLRYFDVVVTGAAKPSFFMHRNPIYEVDSVTGNLRNVVDLDLRKHKVFQGGNFRHLHEMLGIQTGSQILYVGDHIYGDILQSKKELGWRTMLVIEELEHEVATLEQSQALGKQVEKLMHRKDELDDRLQHVLWCREKDRKKMGAAAEEDEEITEDHALNEQIRKLLDERNHARENLRSHLKEYHRQFHPIWGELMKTGHQNSRFAQQVEGYACLYTSRLTNFRHYPPSKSFQSTKDVMPHEEPT